MSTLPPLWHVMGSAMTPGRASGVGESDTRRGFPSRSAAAASRLTTGCVQFPPSHPWYAPSAAITASDPAQEGMLFDPALNKPYRHPSFYTVPDEIGHM